LLEGDRRAMLPLQLQFIEAPLEFVRPFELRFQFMPQAQRLG
jgi:hypothetical protein